MAFQIVPLPRARGAFQTVHLRKDRAWKPADWHTREADRETQFGITRFASYERISDEDATLQAGVLTEEVLAALPSGHIWPAFDGVLEAWKVRKHAPNLLDAEPDDELQMAATPEHAPDLLDAEPDDELQMAATPEATPE